MESNMREDIEHREDAQLVELGAATALTEGDPLPFQKEQVVIADHWDAP
jgi:hypothetical protein